MAYNNIDAICAALSGALSIDINRIRIGEVNIGGGCGNGNDDMIDDDVDDNGGDDNGGNDNGGDDNGGGFVPPIIQFPTIHQNKLKFEPCKGIAEITGVSLYVKEVRISEGQPCTVAPDVTYETNTDTLTFNFGRHHNDDMWNWFWGEVGGNWYSTCNTIWSTDPLYGGVNFGMVGDLTLRYTKTKGGEVFSHTMNDVFIVHFGGNVGNRWNFAGLNWVRDNTLTCHNFNETWAEQLNEKGSNFTMNQNHNDSLCFGERS
jgi:hypothetical protein